MNEQAAKELVKAAITTSSYRWRTPRGIAKESGVPLTQVMELLERSDAFIRSRKGNSQGEPLYTTREKYSNTSSFGQRLISAVTNKISE